MSFSCLTVTRLGLLALVALGCESSGGGGGKDGALAASAGNDSGTTTKSDARALCTPIDDIDCAKVRDAFTPMCALGCATLVMCDETTATALEASCEEQKRAGDTRAPGLACLYTSPKSCDGLNRCLRDCDE